MSTAIDKKTTTNKQISLKQNDHIYLCATAKTTGIDRKWHISNDGRCSLRLKNKSKNPLPASPVLWSSYDTWSVTIGYGSHTGVQYAANTQSMDIANKEEYQIKIYKHWLQKASITRQHQPQSYNVHCQSFSFVFVLLLTVCN